MEAVAHHLRRGLRRRKSGLAILGGAALGATAFAVLSTTPDACPDSSEHLGSVWSRSRRGEIARVLHDRAPQRAEELLAIVDDYAQQWAEAHAELCMIGPDDPRTHDAVRACLLERRAALDQFVALLAESTADLSMDALPPVQSCSEGTPTSDSELEDDQELNELLARADVLFRSGRHHALRGFAGSIAERARATDAPRIAGAARLYEGLAAASLDDYEGADRALRDAYNLALRSGYDQLAADAATRLVDVWSYGMARPDEGLAWARHAETALVRAGADPETDNLLQGALGQAYYAMGRHAEAIEHYERALASSDDEVTLSTDHINLANALGDLERFEEAASHYREAVESLARIQGDAHPSTLTARLDLVASLLDSKKPEEALALLDTVDGHMRGEDVQAELRAMALSTRAAALQQLGDDQAALPALVECARITEAAMGPQHPNTAVALANIGVAFERLGECSEALEHAVRARTIFEGASQYSSRPYAYVRHNAAAALRCLDRDAEAARELTAAIEELERINPSSADLESWRRTLADDLEAARATKAAG
jgi:tetratricopeptide (TPR) repeat protein